MAVKINSKKVDLDEDQIALMQPLMDKARDAGESGKPGFLCAQIFDNEMRVFFIPHEKALKFQELMDQDVGRTGAEEYDH